MYINYGTLFITILLMIMLKYVTQSEKNILIKYNEWSFKRYIFNYIRYINCK